METQHRHNGQANGRLLDPVALYAREIGEEELLNPQQVKDLAAAISRSNAAYEGLYELLASDRLLLKHIFRQWLQNDETLRKILEPEFLEALRYQGEIRNRGAMMGPSVDDDDRKTVSRRLYLRCEGTNACKRFMTNVDAKYDEEYSWFQDIEAGEQARNAFARANLRLVTNTAKRFMGKGLDYQDLIAEGNVGLLRAIETFNPKKAKFSTYAVVWIEQAIQIALLRKNCVSVPAYLQELAAQFRQKEVALIVQEKKPTFDAVAHVMKVTGKKKRKRALRPGERKMLREALKVLPGQNSGHYGQEEGSHTDLEPDDGDAVDFHMRDMMRRVGTTVDLLEPRERTVIRMRFGLDEEEKTLEEVGKKIGLTRERIRQIESKALEKLRDSMGEEQDE